MMLGSNFLWTDILAYALVLWQFFELGNLLIESLKQVSISPTYKLIIIIREQTLKRQILRQKHRFTFKWHYDPYGNLTHLCIIVIVSAALSLVSSDKFIIFSQIGTLLLAVLILLLDLFNWVPTSVKLLLESQVPIAQQYLEWTKQIFSSDEWRKEAEHLRNEINGIHLGDLVPSFVQRFASVLLIVVFTFATSYYLLARLDSSLFADASGQPITRFDEFLYQSVMITTTFGPPFEADGWARVLVAIHAIVTLYLFVLVLAFFGTISEEKLSTEKERFLDDLNYLLTSLP
jgi:hypothetical protein